MPGDGGGASTTLETKGRFALKISLLNKKGAHKLNGTSLEIKNIIISLNPKKCSAGSWQFPARTKLQQNGKFSFCRIFLTKNPTFAFLSSLLFLFNFLFSFSFIFSFSLCYFLFLFVFSFISLSFLFFFLLSRYFPTFLARSLTFEKPQ